MLYATLYQRPLPRRPLVVKQLLIDCYRCSMLCTVHSWVLWCMRKNSCAKKREINLVELIVFISWTLDAELSMELLVWIDFTHGWCWQIIGYAVAALIWSLENFLQRISASYAHQRRSTSTQQKLNSEFLKSLVGLFIAHHTFCMWYLSKDVLESMVLFEVLYGLVF